ncbi:MAG: DUF4342 domain-containing protein [Deltaproteobacteria bacterium]|nr:DUF4342 domain-containing protein [Deltaproteobacteria bacterium]
MTEPRNDDFEQDVKVKGRELLDKVKEIIKEGNARKIIIQNDKGETFLEVPVTVGVFGVLFAPVAAAIGAMAAIATDFTIRIQRKDDVEHD